MKKVEVRLPKGLAVPLGNSLRQIAMSRLRAWRPVAYAISTEFNILHASEDIVEDMTKIRSSISQLVLEPKIHLSGVDMVEDYITFNKELKLANFNSKYFNIVGDYDNNIITSLSDRNITLSVIYRLASGYLELNDNTRFLREYGKSEDNYIVMSSRHTNITNFSCESKNYSVEEESLLITVESEIGNEEEILTDAMNCLKDSVKILEISLANAKDESEDVSVVESAMQVSNN